MKKGIILTVILIIVIFLIACISFTKNNTDSTNNTQNENVQSNSNKNPTSKEHFELENAKDLSNLITEIYKSAEVEMPRVETNEIDISDDDVVKSFTGLENGDDIECLVVSEPLMSSQAYSLVLLKVKDGVDADAIASKMSENIDTRKWICVEAEKLYATSYSDIVFLVMSNEETATEVYNSFKDLLDITNKEYEKTNSEEDIELAPDMY